MSERTTAVATDFMGDLGAAVRANPLPATLIGMGLAWLLSGGRTSAQAGLGVAGQSVAAMGSRLGQTARDAGRSVGDVLASAAGELSSGGAAATQNVSDGASSLMSAVRDAAPTINGEFFASARSNFANLVERQPLLLGAIGITIGAAVAASLRPSATEVDLLGEASADFQEHTRKVASDVTHRAKVVADGVTTTIAKEARRQGLSADGLGQRAADASCGVGTLIDESARRLRSRIN